MEKLSKEGILIGEGILKRHLAELKQDGLIFSGSGRSGSRITEKGKELLKNKKKQKKDWGLLRLFIPAGETPLLFLFKNLILL